MSLENQSALSSSNLSPYPLSETETGFASTTERGAVYHVDFTSDSDYLPETPFADSVYSFSILPIAGSIDQKDPRIEPTIVQTLHVFFDADPKAILLYVCSTENGQERVRSRLFGQWFSRHQKGFDKFDFHYAEQRLYMSAIVRRDLPQSWRVELAIMQAVEQTK
ncbi:DUF6169 family protein [Spirosoma utsteinense]|uniref:Uncharacterized protein n=1 Tax=Spirosoma utsteinense TaxID=2585773 RepID=A0ABR6WD91_9BACT|nr:DUF6169 family protein [Spirosoma utsteinense]MBC3788500.1 hypothetical protein [Spirosoma utsteinense]MBC3794468.1 hypothetical protein [Spirosoma utsteinense]